MDKAKIGLIGLGTMGANLSRNIASKNFQTVVFNRTTEKTTKFIEEYGNENLTGEQDLESFVNKIETPRKIIIMVKAGDPVDAVIQQLLEFVEKDDIIIDCGNENFKVTQRRVNELKKKGIRFVGCGVSGGEEGALHGPSMMPGGSKEAWDEIKEIFEAIAAKDFQGGPCVTYIGDNGAGHYVKMVHNGIEYGVMQMMAEAYEILRTLYKLPAPEIANIFEKYNNGKLKSYLFEICIEVLRKKDDKSDDHLINKILDKAAQKGTGKWTAIDALDRGVGLPSITESVFARIISSDKEKRIKISKIYDQPERNVSIPLEEFIDILENALYSGMLSSYAQGYELIQRAAKEEKWSIPLGEVSRIWEGGCIIRAEILNLLHKSYAGITEEKHLFEIPEITEEMKKDIPDLRKLAAYSIQNGLPLASLSTALSYFESMTSEKVSANLIQGLRDFFGAHTYKRIDQEGDFHTEW